MTNYDLGLISTILFWLAVYATLISGFLILLIGLMTYPVCTLISIFVIGVFSGIASYVIDKKIYK